jgi:SpoVK/Ycf46/Vps4 family AAA+-type ATPase
MITKTMNNNFTAHRNAMREFDWQIRSKRPLLYIISHEEKRVLNAISTVCERDDRRWKLATWDIASGLQSNYEDILPKDDLAMDQLDILQWFEDQAMPTNDFLVLVLKDYHRFLGVDGQVGQVESKVIRALRNISQESATKQKAIVILSPSLHIPQEIEKIVNVIDWPLPETEHINDLVCSILSAADNRQDLRDKFQASGYSDQEMEEIVRAFQGLTIDEVEMLMYYSMLTTEKLDPSLLASHKRDIIRKAGILDWIEIQSGMDSVGGLVALKDWLKKRQGAFSKEAIAYGLPADPKGVLLVGVQGAGKSLCAQAIASYWRLPLLRLDMGKVFSGIVGSSEENIRSVIAIAESVSPCILWADEIDKGLSGSASSNQTDGGTASRVFGSLLTWMQEKKKPVFVVATANDVSQLPPELLRKGRFDEIFFVDLPTEQDRKDIFKIHILKRDRDPQLFDIKALAAESQSFTGAEIEAAIISAMYEAFDDSAREFTTADILKSLQETVPLAVTMKEKIEILRTWAKTRARSANYIKPIIESAEITQARQDIMKDIENKIQSDDVEEEYL